MSYDKGMLRTGNSDCETHKSDEWCKDYEHEHSLSPRECYLPHSCDIWDIGGIREAIELRDDLNAIIAKWQENVTLK